MGQPQRVSAQCAQCGGTQEAGGPIWLGRTADSSFVAAMAAVEAAASVAATVAAAAAAAPPPPVYPLRPLLHAIKDEASLPRACALPLPLPALCRALRCEPMPASTALATLAALGHQSAPTHWSDVVLRPTRAARGTAWAMLREWARQHPAAAGQSGDTAREQAHACMLRRRPEEAEVSFAAGSALQTQKRRQEALQEALPPPKRRKPKPPALPHRVGVAAARGGTAATATARPLPAARGGNTLLPIVGRGPPAGEDGPVGSEAGAEPTACKFGGAGCTFPFAQPVEEEPTETLIVRSSSSSAATMATTATTPITGTAGMAAGLESAGRIYASVGEAVRAARAGALVLISPGTYTEVAPLLLDKRITLRGGGGVGGLGACSITRGSGKGSVLVVDVRGGGGGSGDGDGASASASAIDTQVSISGLEIVQGAAASDKQCEAVTRDATDPPGFAVVVRGGRAVFTRCGMTSFGSGCCFVTAAASAELRSCQLRHAAAHGLLASGKATACLLHCHVRDTSAAAVEVRGRAAVRVHGCRLHHSARSGLFASAFGELHVRGGSPCVRGSNPMCSRLQLLVFRLHLYSGELRVDMSNVFSCSFAAVECSGQAGVWLRANRFHHGQRGGVLAMGRATVRLEENAVYANAMAGLTVRGGARATAERNVVSDGRSSGIYVLEGAEVRLVENQVRGNRLSGLEVGGGDALRLEAVRNVLYGNGTPHSIPPASLPCCLLQGNVLDDPLAEPELTPA